MIRRASLRFASALALAASAGCQLLAGLEGERHLAAGTGTGGTGGTADACVLVVPPKPPQPGGAAGTQDLVFAVRDIDLGESPATAKSVGLDLDGACTCPAAPTCAEPAFATAMHCDGDGGRDNAVGQAFFAINQAFGVSQVISSLEFSQQAIDGKWSILVRVRDYDGTSDDPQVRAALYLTPGLGGKPAWDGTDAWPVADSSLVDQMTLDAPLFEDASAYVSGGVLVAHFPAASLLFLSLGVHLAIDLERVVLTGTITPTDAGGPRLTKGTFAGQWRLSDLFNDLSNLRVNGGMPLCVDSPYYPTVKRAFCTSVDAASTSAKDAPCDALSFGMGFDAYPAQLGTPVMVTPPGNGCAMTTDPGTDTCGP